MVSAYVLVSVEAGKNQDVVAALRQVAGVTPTHTCWGQPDIFAYVKVDDDNAMADTELVTIHAISGVGRPKPTSWRRCRALQTRDQPDPPSSGYAWPPSTRRRRTRRAAGRHLPPARRPRHLSGAPGDGGATLQLVGPEIGLTLLAQPGTPCHHAFGDSV
jgi:hypothetical protein